MQVAPIAWNALLGKFFYFPRYLSNKFIAI